MKLMVVGATGRMGRAVAAVAAETADVELVGGVADTQRTEEEAHAAGYPRVVAPEHARRLIPETDVILDLSTPAALLELLDEAEETMPGKGLVVGTTGLERRHHQRLEELAANAAVLVASNFSAGVNVLLDAVERLARTLPAGSWDIEVVEAHHRGKADAPSGTALSLADAAARARSTSLEEVRRDGRRGQVGARPTGEIGLHAVRGGGVAGEHRVLFLGDGERLELTHLAGDRSLFARGALDACRWLAGRASGRYTMADVLGL